jgi:hypothetical protein
LAHIATSFFSYRRPALTTEGHPVGSFDFALECGGLPPLSLRRGLPRCVFRCPNEKKGLQHLKYAAKCLKTAFCCNLVAAVAATIFVVFTVADSRCEFLLWKLRTYQNCGRYT